MHPRQVAGCFAHFIGRFTAARALCAFPYAPPVTAFSVLRFRPAFVVRIPVAGTARFAFVMPNAVFIEGFRYRNSFISILFSKQIKALTFCKIRAFHGGPYWTRTSDPIDVNDVLYQLSQRTESCPNHWEHDI